MSVSKQVLYWPIFSIGHSNVTSSQIARLTRHIKFVKPIIPLARPEKDKLVALWYIDYTCHNTPGDTTSGRYVIKIPRFDSGTPGEWIIFVELVQKSLVGQNVTTGPPMYKCMERVLKGDAKA